MLWERKLKENSALVRGQGTFVQSHPSFHLSSPRWKEGSPHKHSGRREALLRPPPVWSLHFLPTQHGSGRGLVLPFTITHEGTLSLFFIPRLSLFLYEVLLSPRSPVHGSPQPPTVNVDPAQGAGPREAFYVLSSSF